MLIVIVGIGLVVASGGVVADNSADLEDLDGDGSEGEPYVITNVSELQAMNDDLGAHYELGEDINASETGEWNEDSGEPQGFVPIGEATSEFNGTFDGQGYEIDDLFINRDEQHVALFAMTTEAAVIEDVYLKNATVRGPSNTAALVGTSEGKLISNVSATVDIEATPGGVEGNGLFEIGGIIGSNTAQIENVSAKGTVTAEGADHVGGLVGYSSNQVEVSGNVTNSHANVTVDANDGTNVGGLVGYTGNQISHSFASGNVEGDENVGGLVGDTDGTVENSYWDIETTSQSDPAGSNPEEYGLTTSQMTGLNATEEMTGFDFPIDGDGTWHVTHDYPALGWQNSDGFFEVNLTDTNAPVEEGDTLEVTASVSNWGGSDEQPVTLTSDSTELNETTAVLDSGESNKSVTLTWEPESGDAGDQPLTVSSPDDSDDESVTIDTASSSSSSSSSSSPTPDPANISVTDATLNESQIDVNESVVVNATLENDGDETGTESITFRASGDEFTTESVTIDGESEQTISVVETFGEAGEYEITANDEETTNLSVTELETPNFEIIFVDASYGILEPGEEEFVTITVANDGDAAGDAEVVLDLDGEESSETLELDAGRADDAEFWLNAPDEVGEHEYNISVGDEETTETMIVEARDPEWNIDDFSFSPEIAEPGEDVDMAAIVENTGGVGTVSVDFYIDNEAADSQDVDVDGGHSKTVEATLIAPEDEGRYEIGVTLSDSDETYDGSEDEIVVGDVSAVDEDESPEENDDDELDDGQPGFGVLATFASIIFLILTHSRRQR